MNLLKKLASRSIRRIPEDDFIKRLSSLLIGHGMLHPGNLWLFDYALKNMPANGSVVEIGSYGGLSANLLIHLMRKHHRTETFYTCDPWIYEGYHDHKGTVSEYIDGTTTVTRTNYSAYMKEAFIRATQFLHSDCLPHSIHCTSDDFFKYWQNGETVTDVFGRTVATGGKISFAYIDGDHSYSAARNDFENCAAHLLPGGFILMDDSAETDAFGSAKLANELRTHRDFEVVYTNPNYLLRKRMM